MVPAEDPKEHFDTKRRVVVCLYIQSVPISCKVIWKDKMLMLFTTFFFGALERKVCFPLQAAPSYFNHIGFLTAKQKDKV